MQKNPTSLVILFLWNQCCNFLLQLIAITENEAHGLSLSFKPIWFQPAAGVIV